MGVVYRRAAPDDVAACIDLRGRTRENAVSVERLKAAGITLESWRRDVADDTLPGYVGLADGRIVAYCFGLKDTGEIAVLALLPEYEGRGIGKTLLAMMVRDFRSIGFDRLLLGCSTDPKTRSYGFYRHLGWRSTGTFDAANDEVLETFPGDEPALTMETKRALPATIDDYVAGFSPDVRAILERIRATIRKAAPDAQETISYRIPAFMQNGVLAYFAAFKHHIGFYPPVRGDAGLLKQIAKYAGPKGNLQFPLDQPMPYALIERIVRHRVKQNMTKAPARKKPA